MESQTRAKAGKRPGSSRNAGSTVRHWRVAVGGFAALTVLIGALYAIPGQLAPLPTSPRAAPTMSNPAPTGTTAVDAAKLTASATRFQAERAAGATEYAAQLTAFSASQSSVRSARLAICAGALAMLTALVALLGYRETVRRNRQDLRVAVTEQRDNRFANAIEHLSHAEPAVRMGGVFTLGALTEEDRWRAAAIVQVLASFTASDQDRRSKITLGQLPVTWTGPADNWVGRFSGQIDPRRVPASSRLMAAAYHVIARARTASADPWLTPELPLAFAYLARKDLQGVDLRGADLRGADLTGAYLVDADLSQANLEGASLRNAIVTGARLAQAKLSGAYVQGANLADTDLAEWLAQVPERERELSKLATLVRFGGTELEGKAIEAEFEDPADPAG